MAGRKSSSKGARGEREYINLLSKYGIEGTRTSAMQRNSGDLMPDVVHGEFGVEVKYRNQFSMADAIAAVRQAESSSARMRLLPYLAYKKTNAKKKYERTWIVILPQDTFSKVFGDIIVPSSSRLSVVASTLASSTELRLTIIENDDTYLYAMLANDFLEKVATNH